MNYSVMDIDELCTLLLISRKSAYRLLNSGKLKGLAVNGKFLTKVLLNLLSNRPK